jgi:SWI/SNF-related matrix-associated actin-dependent regulator of chromatin subfamily A protein 2/4
MALIAYLWENKGNRGPHLIIVPNAVIVNWRSEMRAWLPSVNAVFYVGHREAREKLFVTDVAPLTFNVLVTTYEFIMKDRSKLCKIKWRYLIIDEAQRMKDRESKLSRDLDYFECQNRLLLTGTPLQNDISELWALLNLLLPHVFDSYSAFQSWFSTDGDGDKPGADEWLMKEKRVIVISRLHQILEPFMLRRRIEDVESKLPPKVTHVVYAPMPAYQGAAYEWVKNTGTLRLDPEYLVGAVARAGRRAYAPLQNKAMELRKMVNHPCLSYPPERGGYFEGDLVVRTCGKLWLLDRMLVKLHASGHRVLLFSTMTKLLDTLERYLDWRRLEGGYNMRHCRIDGTTPLEDREKSIGEFNTPGSDLFIFLLSIRAAGRGLNLQSADTVVVYDPDPNPKNEEQAVARAHRIGQKREVRVFHFEAVADAPADGEEDAAAGEEAEEEEAGAEAAAAGGDGDAVMRDAQAPPGPRVDFTGGYRRRQRRATVGSVESLVRNTIQAQKIEMADEVINAGRFDQRTTQQERRATLEELVRDTSREGPASHVVPRLQDLNAMMARTPEELRLFDSMDRDPNIIWPSWQTDAAELPHWLSYAPREVVAAQAHVAKPKPGRAGEMAAAAAVAAEMAAQGQELGRGVRGVANREVQQARNMAVRLYEQGRLDLDEMDDSAAVAAATEAAALADAAEAPPEAPAPKAFSFKLKLSAAPPAPAAAAAPPAAAVSEPAPDDDDDVVLAPEVREDEEEGIEAPDPDDSRHDSASEGGAPEEDDSAQPSRPPFDEEDSERASAGAALREEATDADADGMDVDDAEDDDGEEESPSAKRARLADEE